MRIVDWDTFERGESYDNPLLFESMSEVLNASEFKEWAYDDLTLIQLFFIAFQNLYDFDDFHL